MPVCAAMIPGGHLCRYQDKNTIHGRQGRGGPIIYHSHAMPVWHSVPTCLYKALECVIRAFYVLLVYLHSKKKNAIHAILAPFVIIYILLHFYNYFTMPFVEKGRKGAQAAGIGTTWA